MKTLYLAEGSWPQIRRLVREGALTPINVEDDRLLPYHVLNLEDESWTMAHPLHCDLALCQFHDQMVYRGKPPYPDGKYDWWHIDDDPTPST